MPIKKVEKAAPEKVSETPMPEPVVTENPINKESSFEPRYSQSNGNASTYTGKPVRGKGVLEMMSEGYGFLRASGSTPGAGDIYISQSQIRRFDIRPGDEVEGEVRPPKETERYFGMLKVEKVNGLEPDVAMKRKKIEHLVAIYPDKQLKLETDKLPLSTRMIDILAPVGFGQRGMIVSPPKECKTTI